MDLGPPKHGGFSATLLRHFFPFCTTSSNRVSSNRNCTNIILPENSHHNTFEFKQVGVQFAFFSFFPPEVWVQLMKTPTVSPTQASDSAACWLRDLLAVEPSIKRGITPTLTPQTAAVVSCLSSCWLGASDGDPRSCPGYVTEVHRESRRGLGIHSTHGYIANLSSVYSHMFKKLQPKTVS